MYGCQANKQGRNFVQYCCFSLVTLSRDFFFFTTLSRITPSFILFFFFLFDSHAFSLILSLSLSLSLSRSLLLHTHDTFLSHSRLSRSLSSLHHRLWFVFSLFSLLKKYRSKLRTMLYNDY